MQVVVKTTAGVSLFPPAYVVPVVVEGEVRERFLSELRPGDVLYYRKDSSSEANPIKLEDVVGILYKEVPGYKQARNFLFLRDNGNETTRLRYDLIKAFSKKSPEMFSRDELGRLETLIFRKGGEDFSDNTLGRLTTHLYSILEADGIRLTENAYVRWLDGRTIHPENHVEAVRIAKLLGSESFNQRALEILTSEGSQNKYRNLVATHAVTMAMLSAPKAMGKGVTKETQPTEEKEPILKWFATAVEKLKPRMQENVCETKLLGIEFVEGKEGEWKESARIGLSRGVIGYSQESGTLEHLYERLKMERVKPRHKELKEALDLRLGLMEEAYAFTTAHCLEKLTIWLEKQDVLPAYVAYNVNIESVSTLGAKILNITHPSVDYSLEKYLADDTSLDGIMQKCIRDRSLRKRFLTEMVKTLPKDHPLYQYYSSVYDNSTLLSAVMSKREFLENAACNARVMHYTELEETAKRSGLRKSELEEEISRTNEDVKEKIAAFTDICRQQEMQRILSEMKMADSRIPSELVVLFCLNASFPTHGLDTMRIPEDIRSMTLKVENPIGDLSFVKKILGGYGLRLDWFNDKQEKFAIFMKNTGDKAWEQEKLPPEEEVFKKIRAYATKRNLSEI